ncbi:MAG: TlpA disulfide reductase family protein [Bacteroidota bacterium]
MIRIPLITLCLILFCSASSFSQKAPNFRLKNLKNKTVSYKQIKGEKLTVIDFWATWCKPCVKSIPKFVEMNDEFEEQGVQFIGISIDSPRNLAKVRPFTKSLGVDYPILLDQETALMARMRVQAVPTLLIVDADDNIVYFHEGWQTGEEQKIREKIKALLETE